MIVKAEVPGTGIKVSRLIMGVVMTEDNYSEQKAVYDRYWELGGNTFDLAYIYGGGSCTKAVGRWIAEHGLKNEAVIYDKGCHHAAGPRVSPEDMESDLTAELERLGMEQIAFWTFHRDNPSYPVGPLVDKAAEWARQGRVQWVGGSNWLVNRIVDWNTDAVTKGVRGMSHNNPNLSLATVNEPMWAEAHTITQEEKDWHRQTQFPLFSWSSTGGGWFAEVDSPDVRRVYSNPVNESRRQRAKEMAKDKGLNAVQIALAYTLSHPFPVWALVGPYTVGQLEELAEASEVRLTPEEMLWLEQGE